MTLTDEGTLISGGVTKKRQQKIYSDVLGRTVKTEILNWDGAGPNGTGGSVYSATVNTYNGRDQVTLARQFQGSAPANANDLSCPSGTCQQTSMTYDGFGRVKTKHVPQQDAGTATSWDYNPDDTVQKVTDARDASATYAYNGRQQVTGITYAAPSGITIPNPASFAYDAAGNRISMTDSAGSVSYNYDGLSRMTSEMRTFAGLAGAFTLSYDYNLGGDLKTLTYGNSATIAYGYDAIGRTKTMTGWAYSGVTQYVSDIKYRGWGGPKSISYGNDTLLELGYTSRLQLQRYNMKGALYQGQRGDTALVEHQYYADGSLRYAHDISDERFDRAQRFDQVGRLTEAYSGFEAREYVNQPGSSAWGSYRQTYQHGAFDDLTSRISRFWSQGDSFSATYANRRNQDPAWQYDANGNVRFDKDFEYTYDASGTNATMRVLSDNTTITQTLDGDGDLVKRSQSQRFPVYYLRSSVLGGKVATEIDGLGHWVKNNIYLEGGVVATQTNGTATQEPDSVVWRHENPITGKRGESVVQGFYSPKVEPDAMGVNVGFSDPYDNPPPPPEEPDIASLFPGFPGRCRVEGMPFDCAEAWRMLTGNTAVRCPDDNCGSFQASADGWSGRLPAGIYYVGDALVFGSIWTGRASEEFPLGEDDGSGLSVSYFIAQPDKKKKRPPRRSVSLPQNSGRVPFEGEALKDYKEMRARLLELLMDPNSDCSKYLKDKVDVTGRRIARTVRAQRAFDGDRSTISMANAGLLPRRGTYNVGGVPVSSEESVNTFFARRIAVGYQAGYARASTGATLNDVYYAPHLFSISTILHEAMHTLLDLEDPGLDARGADVVNLSSAGCNSSGKAYAIK